VADGKGWIAEESGKLWSPFIIFGLAVADLACQWKSICALLVVLCIAPTEQRNSLSKPIQPHWEDFIRAISNDNRSESMEKRAINSNIALQFQ
jgi:hypothetical protein